MDELLGLSVFFNKDKERASQILNALDGLSIYEAQSLLEACRDALARAKFRAD